MIFIKVKQYYISVTHKMLKYLDSSELTGSMKYKDIYVPSKSMLKMPLFRALMLLWYSLILYLHSDSCYYVAKSC